MYSQSKGLLLCQLFNKQHKPSLTGNQPIVTMHIFKDNTIWHSYTKCKEGITYGIITKRVNGVLVLNLKATFETRKEAKKATNNRCKQLSIEEITE